MHAGDMFDRLERCNMNENENVVGENKSLADNDLNNVSKNETVEIVGVRFKKVGKIYYFDPRGLTLPYESIVIVETVRGLEIGKVVIPNRIVSASDKFLPLSPVVRVATEDDFKTNAVNKEKEKAAWGICEEKIKKHGLEMTLTDIEYTFDNSKITFSFVADGRVDFRELVKDLASVFRTRIELRQIGVRDETKDIGGIGMCGRPVCCKTFLSEFSPVSVKMAKDQSLSTNPQKISGTCGKLLCCLNYEQPVYEEIYKTLPKVSWTVKTADGTGSVIESNALSETVKVQFGDGTSKVYGKDDVTVISRTEDKDDSINNQQ